MALAGFGQRGHYQGSTLMDLPFHHKMVVKKFLHLLPHHKSNISAARFTGKKNLIRFTRVNQFSDSIQKQAFNDRFSTSTWIRQMPLTV